MDPVYGLPALAGLIVLLVYVRRVARRARLQRLDRSKRPTSRGVRTLSQRSEMRAGNDPITVMDSMKLSVRSTTPPPQRAKGGKR